MKKESVFVILIMVMMSCSITKDLTDKSFSYKSKNRTLELFFESDSICRLVNTFHCNDIDPKYKELVTYCSYNRVDSKVYLRNTDCNTDTCEYDLFIEIPSQNSVKCDFLNESSREKQMFAPNYSTDFEKYGRSPLIDLDTLQIVKNKIVLYKQNGTESIGFIFR